MYVVLLAFFVFVAYFAILIVAVVILGLCFQRELQRVFIDVAAEFVTLAQYFTCGARGHNLLGQWDNLMDEMQGLGDYKRIHFVGYSFGTIVAMDAIYRPCSAPPKRYRQVLDHLVTLGCPFDIIPTYRPFYYSKERCWHAGSPEVTAITSTNVFTPGDVFGSNFRNNHHNNLDSNVCVENMIG